MLAAMPPTPPSTPPRDEARIRDRGDACPGALRLHAADDGRLARLRLPAGRLTAHQVETLAVAAETLGDGRISLTSRGNAELRGLAEECGAELAALLTAAGLLPSPTHERVRNIVASPAAGLDGLGGPEVQLWARELDALLCAEPWAAALSGRFLFVLDDGRADVAGLGGDVTLVAPAPGAPAGPGAARLYVGGRAWRVAGADAPRAALAAAGAFLDAARAAGNGAWRVRELPEGCAPDVAGALDRAGISAEPVPAAQSLLVHAPPLAPGPLGAASLHVLAPLGRLTAAQLRALLPADEVRLTPWRGVVVAGAGPSEDRLAALGSHGLITRPDSPWAGVSACTGRPGCAKSLADVRADAAPGSARGLPVHYSGCERRCGHPHGTWVDVVATADGAYLVDGAPTPRTALPDAVTTARTTR
ncbi:MULTISPECIES: cobalamin biosynthesis protein CobG [Streptomyces]|uniref:Cobalamin biosynthesis protein CobG n=1 Tax=Streptomyces venezuelae TaxID=54571 RepID=A0A5P2AUC1_STRVZ|nr:cobalamin biosynthesis protein CobG [Streptomyces venezuelae]QES21210.1 cobalamin biosynthesis protein CobG [Streptomyces venezuelae]